MTLDPAFHVGLTRARRYLLQKGDMAGAIEATLAGSAANPAYSQGLLTTAIAYYQNGDVALAEQALDNADRLDPNDAIVSIVRTAIAIDQYRADEAVLSAREALRRARARGGDQEGIAVNRQSGSYPVAAYRFINLNEWARFYGDRTFDPFAASSYFDQASIARPSLLLNVKPSLSTVETGADADLATFNLLVQGLLFDPLAVSGRIGRIDLLRRPFLDVEIGGGLTGKGGELGWQTDATVQGYSNAPVPTSFSLAASRLRAKGRLSIDDESADSAAFFVGAAPSASDRFLLYGTAAEAGARPDRGIGARSGNVRCTAHDGSASRWRMEPQLRRPERSDRRLLWHPRRHAPLQSAKRVRTCGLHASRSDRGAQGTHRRRRACAQSQRRVRRRDDPIRRRGTIGRREKQRCPSPPDAGFGDQGFPDV